MNLLKYAIFVLSLLAGLLLPRFVNDFNGFVVADVGQADLVLYRDAGISFIIDTGKSVDAVWVLDRYLGQDRVIDYLLITHPHMDHYGGVFELLERYPVAMIFVSDVCQARYEEVDKFILSRGGEIQYLTDDYTFSFAETTINILYPNGFGCLENSNINNTSLIVEATRKDDTYLFMGDAEADVEWRLIENWHTVDFVKVGHHCSDTSSSNLFVESVRPQIVVCSVGRDNKYGHPSPITVDRWESVGAEVSLTLSDGDYVRRF